jgi:UDP-N-acetylmuramyl pentapeptide phosphotransferase/UDP-N-acetylglucosamine-1-phosphate transferase
LGDFDQWGFHHGKAGKIMRRRSAFLTSILVIAVTHPVATSPHRGRHRHRRQHQHERRHRHRHHLPIVPIAIGIGICIAIAAAIAFASATYCATANTTARADHRQSSAHQSPAET